MVGSGGHSRRPRGTSPGRPASMLAVIVAIVLRSASGRPRCLRRPQAGLHMLKAQAQHLLLLLSQLLVAAQLLLQLSLHLTQRVAVVHLHHQGLEDDGVLAPLADPPLPLSVEELILHACSMRAWPQQ
jgi:hypothetical protein